MGNIFGKEKPLKERIREELRGINKSIRDTDRQVTQLQNSEKQLNGEIRRLHESGQQEAVRIKCKNLVRNRNAIKQFIKVKSNLEGIKLNIQSAKSHHDIGEALKGTVKAMESVNKAMKSNEINQIMKDFTREHEKSEMQQEMMGDAIDDALDEPGTMEAEEEVYQAIMAEMGLEQTQKLSAVPNDTVGIEQPATKVPAGGQDDDAQAELDARLMNVRRNNP